jgi:Family of unknown function (DUF6263)
MKLLSTALLLLALPQEKVELRWKWQKGQELVYKSTTRTLMQFGGQPIDQQMGYTFSMTATDVSESGEASIVVKYLAVVAKGVGPGGEFEYDSEKDKEPPAEGPAAIQARMVGQSFTMKMTPRGQVTEVKGYDKVLEAMMKGVGDEASPMKMQLKQLFNNDIFKGMMQRMAPPLPEGKVGKGETWADEFVVKMPMLGGMKFAMKAALAGLKDGNATIEQDVQIGIASENGENPLAGLMEIKDGRVKATAVFWIGKGCYLSQKSALEMKISAGGTEMPMKSIVELLLVTKK